MLTTIPLLPQALATVTATDNNYVSVASIVLGFGMILKATAGAIYPDASLRSATQKISLINKSEKTENEVYW